MPESRERKGINSGRDAVNIPDVKCMAFPSFNRAKSKGIGVKAVENEEELRWA